MEATTIGIDLAKSIFHLVGMSQTGKVVWRKALTRARLLEFLVQHQRAVVGMEACATAHYWAREIQKLGARSEIDESELCYALSQERQERLQ